MVRKGRSPLIVPTQGRAMLARKSPATLPCMRGGHTELAGAMDSQNLWGTPAKVFDNCLLSMVGTAALWKMGSFVASKRTVATASSDAVSKPANVHNLQLRFLAVFWLLRMADWLQGPYFFEVFSSKSIRGVPVTTDMVAKIFLLGFATTGAVGPILGQLVDSVGRKRGTLAFAALYVLSALSTCSNNLALVLLGRVAGGLGTSLLFSAPEAWLVGEHERQRMDGWWLGQTFGWAYAGDAVVAILAGQLATLAARHAGPSGPFLLSIAFLVAGAGVVLWKWEENTAAAIAQTNPVPISGTSTEGTAVQAPPTAVRRRPSMKSAVTAMLADRKILLLGAVQALFEGAMYIFVLQWPVLVKEAILSSSFGTDASVPYGGVFSCFMASCLLGSTMFGSLQRSGASIEKSALAMLTIAAAALSTATHIGPSNLLALTAALFVFEACVGMYFPSIGSLRSKYLPDQHRSVMMNLFGIPLNLIVVSIVLGMKRLGTKGALSIASAALCGAAVCMSTLIGVAEKEKQQKEEERED